MSRAVQFEKYGDVDALHVVDVPTPSAGPGRVVVEVRASELRQPAASGMTGVSASAQFQLARRAPQ